MDTHEFEFSVSDLDAAGKDYRFPVRSAWLRSVLEGTDLKAGSHEGAIEIRASKSGTDVVVHGTLKAELVTPCARCLGDAEVKIDGPLSVLLVPGKSANDDDELSPDQADVATYEGDIVVLDDVVKDEILLEIPMIPLCSEDCPGMSPGPSQKAEAGSAASEESIDPRLLPLLKLKQEEQSKKKERKG